MSENEPMTCPSSSCEPGHLLLGIVRRDGTVAAVRPPLEIDAEFVDRATSGQRPPQARMRFAGSCVTDRCRHWGAGRCAVGDLVAAAGADATDAPPPCPIRATCQWWAQTGVAACHVCPTIVHTRHVSDRR